MKKELGLHKKRKANMCQLCVYVVRFHQKLTLCDEP